jgi:hypothetical protein
MIRFPARARHVTRLALAAAWMALAATAGWLSVAASPVAAATQPLFGSPLFAFPGATTNPASAASAGLAIADRWLGDDPFDNPAAASALGGQLSGAILHVSRQDLRATNRNFDETPAFVDGSGLVVGLPAHGRFGFNLYAFQPLFEQESNAFTRGSGTPDPANPPGTVEAQSTASEMRAGAAVSAALGRGRVGAALEWVRRDDQYQVLEESGSPESGTRQLDLTGDGIGFQIGATLDRGDSNSRGIRVGLGIRRHPALPADASLSQALLTGSTDTTLSVEREAGWEIGTSARYTASPAVRVLASLGGRSERAWQGFDFAAGHAWEWKVALEYHDARDPWTLRLGLGQQHESDVPEPRADDLGLGLGWRFAHVTTDLGLLHRTLVRTSTPHSFEDRIVLTVRTP